MIDWSKHYTRPDDARGATSDEIIALIGSVRSPLTAFEIIELNEEHQRIVGDGCFDPPFDPTLWQLPAAPLPRLYLDLLRWTNGGYLGRDRYDLDPLFSTDEVREYMLGYSIPHWMPGCCPFAFDGGGGFYLFDMRRLSQFGDYPILFAHAGNLGFEDAKLIAPTFAAFAVAR